MTERLEIGDGKRKVETIPQQDQDFMPTDTWECSSDSCNGWMRQEFSFQSSPACPLCKAPMKRGARMIPRLKKIFRKTEIKFGKERRLH